MATAGATPIRMCRVCRQRLPKHQLHRWVIEAGQLVADDPKRRPGRGYYLCDLSRCRELLPKVLKIKTQPI